MADASEQQRRYREFLDLLPLTISLAGLPPAELGKSYSEEQIEGRSYSVKHAYKIARQCARECIAR